MSRIVDSLASCCYFLAASVIACGLTIWTLGGELCTSLRNIWSRP